MYRGFYFKDKSYSIIDYNLKLFDASREMQIEVIQSIF